MDLMKNTKQCVLSLVETFVNQRVIRSEELRRFAKNPLDPLGSEFIKQILEDWYKNLGIESIIGRKFTLSPCPFTPEELQEAVQQNEIVLCVPGKVNRRQLGELFRINSWALHDPLVTQATEREDFWFKTRMSLTPEYMNITGIEIQHRLEDENKVPFSIERYLVFIARIRQVLRETPDSEYWIWLPRGLYDRSGMLIAGFDRNGVFSVHGWMPHFSAGFLGARYGILPRAKTL
jgi:hypothetical protein